MTLTRIAVAGLGCALLIIGCGGSKRSSSKTAGIGSTAAMVVSTASLPNGQVGAVYSATLTASGGQAPYTWLTVSGTLPAGLALDANTGVLNGTPTQAQNSVITFQVIDSGLPARVANRDLSLTIDANPTTPTTLEVSTSFLAIGRVGVAYSHSLVASGGQGPYRWQALTPLPAGLTLDPVTGELSGTPTRTAQNVSVTFEVTDSSSPVQTASRALGVTIDPPANPSGFQITTDSLPNGRVGVPYAERLAVSGGRQPFTWRAMTALPPGLGLIPVTGIIDGTPTQPGAVVTTFEVTDSSTPPQTAVRSVRIVVDSLGQALPGRQLVFTALNQGIPYTATDFAETFHGVGWPGIGKRTILIRKDHYVALEFVAGPQCTLTSCNRDHGLIEWDAPPNGLPGVPLEMSISETPGDFSNAFDRSPMRWQYTTSPFAQFLGPDLVIGRTYFLNIRARPGTNVSVPEFGAFFNLR